tara:strand:- start:2772 stop:3281 length:510 start_codon:yes stop_codon:yes gene_type:complete
MEKIYIDSNSRFYNQDYFTSNYFKKSDLIICADVFEHIYDYTDFLKKLLTDSRYFLFHIPLEISLLTLIRKDSFFRYNFSTIRHIHFYTKYTALLLLEYCVFKIIDNFFAKNRIEYFNKNKISFKRELDMFPQCFIDKLNEYLSCSIFSGYSLVFLCENLNFQVFQHQK